MPENNGPLALEEKVTTDEVISDLSLTNLGLRRLLDLLSDENQKLQTRIKELEEQIRQSVDIGRISKYVQEQFAKGRIPLPLHFRKSIGITEVLCAMDQIRFLGDGIIVPVYFSNPATHGESVTFIMKLVPAASHASMNYPGFKLEYVSPPKKRVHTSKKKAVGSKSAAQQKDDTST